MNPSYEETMRYGTDQYRDVLDALSGRGLPAEFMQTGGMNAAITITLEAGYYLLIADLEESLAWDRDQHVGWYVGLYFDIDNPGSQPLQWRASEDSDVPALIACVDSVLRAKRST